MTPVFDVQLHAYDSLDGFRSANFDFKPHHKVAGGTHTNPDEHLSSTLKYMNQAGVRKAVISGTNSTVQKWREQHEDRFLASYVPDLSLENHNDSVNEFRKGVEEGLWRGLGELGLPYSSRPLNDEILFPYYEVCEEYGVPVSFHSGLDGPTPYRFSPAFDISMGDPLLLEDVLRTFPDLDVIVMHMGWPFFDHALYLLYAYPNVFVDIGVVNYLLGPSVFERMVVETVETVGARRMLFGSDQMAWPQMIPEAVKATTDADYLTEDQKAKILWENAVRLYDVNDEPGNT